MSRPLDAVGVLRSLNPTLRPRLDEICAEVTRLDAAEEELGPGEVAHVESMQPQPQRAQLNPGQEAEASAAMALVSVPAVCSLM